MAIDRDEAIGMSDKDRIAQAIRRYGQVADIAIGGCEHWQPLLSTRAYVQSHMKMTFPQLAKIGCQLQGPVQRGAKITI